MMNNFGKHYNGQRNVSATVHRVPLMSGWQHDRPSKQVLHSKFGHLARLLFICATEFWTETGQAAIWGMLWELEE